MAKRFRLVTQALLIAGLTLIPAWPAQAGLILLGYQFDGSEFRLQVVNGTSAAVTISTDPPDQGFNPYDGIITNLGTGQWVAAVRIAGEDCVFRSSGAVGCDPASGNPPNKAGRFIELNGENAILNNAGTARLADPDGDVGTPTLRAYTTWDGQIFNIDSNNFDANPGDHIATVRIFSTALNQQGTTQTPYRIPTSFNILDVAYYPDR